MRDMKAFLESNKWVPRREGMGGARGELGASENSVRYNSRFRAVSVQMAAVDLQRITKPP